MPAHTKLWYLQHFRLLDVLGKPQMQTLEQATRMFEVKRRERIYLTGDPSDQVFLLKTGVVKIVTVAPDGRQAILAFLYAGDIFGELALIDDSPRSHVVEAHEDAVICAVDRALFLQIMRESPDLGYRITKIMGLRLRRCQSHVADLLYMSAHARVARILLDLADQYGVADAAGVLVRLRLSQRDLANLVGLTRETVNAVIQDLRHRGLIESDRRRVRVKNAAGLRAVR